LDGLPTYEIHVNGCPHSIPGGHHMSPDDDFSTDEILRMFEEPPLPDDDDPVDMHAHTDASDGSYPPAELIRRAAEAGLAAIAVTDHDTLAGLPEAVAAGADMGIRVIPGVELSCRIPGGTLHILGYFVSPGGPLGEKLAWLRGQRLARGEQIVGRLNGLGLQFEPEKVRALAGGASLGRPHIAQALIDAGHVADAKEAFDRYLAKGRPAYVDKAVLPKEEAIGAIIGSGGVAVMAHPHQTNLGGEPLDALVSELASLGVRGIEAHYSLHSPRQLEEYLRLADRHGLRVTGGTDFHGPRKPDISLGTGKGDMHIPFAFVRGILDELKSKNG
jgi:predicted metal-dependent phosphoesterase TrpH